MSARTGRKRGAPPKYPWDRWFALGRFTLIRGKHFDITTAGMIQSIRQRASKNGFMASVRNVANDTLEVQVWPLQ